MLNVGAYTPKPTDVVAVRLPEVPVIVTLYWPMVALLLADNVSTLLPDVALALHDAVTPLGSEDVTARLTLPLNPLICCTYIVVAA